MSEKITFFKRSIGQEVKWGNFATYYSGCDDVVLIERSQSYKYLEITEDASSTIKERHLKGKDRNYPKNRKIYMKKLNEKNIFKIPKTCNICY